MKPPNFDYYDPRELEEVFELLGRYQGDAKILAGGQSLIALLNFRLSRPAALIDINRLPHLSYIEERDGRLCFGALTRQRTIEFSTVVRERLPLMAEATQYVGHLPTRTRGTIGGSLAHADPAAEYPALVTALDAELVIGRATGQRIMKAREFFRDVMTTALEPDEVLLEVRIPPMPSGAGWAFEEFSRRHGDFAIVAVAAQLAIDRAGRCSEVRLAAAGAGPTPVRLQKAEKILLQSSLSDEVLAEAAQSASEEVEPSSDIHAPADYRRHLTRVLTKRALCKALARAKERQS